MNPNIDRPDDLEALSALHDDELDGDARQFALRRLGHDANWQRACGQWQLIGDALRRQAPIAAPADFAGRVSAAVAAEPASSAAASASASAAAAGTARTASRSGRRRWIGGGALAASLAMVVAVSSLPFGDAPPATTAQPTLAAVDAAPGPGPQVVAERRATASISAPALRAPDATAVETVAPPLRQPAAPDVRVASVAPARDRRMASGPTVRSTPRNVATAPLLIEPQSNPFNLGAGEALTARPWPRASLGSGSAGPFTTRYAGSGESDDARPTFHPFEPRAQDADEHTRAPAP